MKKRKVCPGSKIEIPLTHSNIKEICCMQSITHMFYQLIKAHRIQATVAIIERELKRLNAGQTLFDYRVTKVKDGIWVELKCDRVPDFVVIILSTKRDVFNIDIIKHYPLSHSLRSNHVNIFNVEFKDGV